MVTPTQLWEETNEKFHRSSLYLVKHYFNVLICALEKKDDKTCSKWTSQCEPHHL